MIQMSLMSIFEASLFQLIVKKNVKKTNIYKLSESLIEIPGSTLLSGYIRGQFQILQPSFI